MTTVSAAVAEVIGDHTTEVFALMGNGNAYLTDALARQGRVRITALRHEAGTVASADAYHRVSRRIAAATTTYGPGYTNALTPLAEAAMARTPLVFVVGGEPTTGRRPWDLDQAALAETVGARSLAVDTASPRAATRRAFEIASVQRRPVVLFIPYDIAAAEAAEEFAGWENVPLPAPAAGPAEGSVLADVAAAADLLAASRRPLVLAGRGARDAAGKLGELADRIGALTVSSAPARGTFAGREWDLGVCGGFASEDSSKLIRQADVVLVVGAGMNQFTTAFGTQFSPEAILIQIDLEPHPTNPRVDRFLHGDAETITDALLESLAPRPARDDRWDGVATQARGSRLTFSRDRGTGLAADGRLDPRSAVARLNDILPANRQVVSDGGHFIGWANSYFDLPAPDSLALVGTHFQSIGLGFPSAPGAVRARPEATTVVVTGDGGGIMGLPDLDSLIRTARSCVVLVFNDACYGAEIHQYGSRGLHADIMQIDQADFTKLAEGFGAAGVVVQTLDDLDAAERWVEAGARGTLLLDLRISNTVVAPYIQEIIELTLKKD